MKMMRRTKNVCVALLIVMLLVEVLFSECEGCLKQENDALLRLKAHFGNPGRSFHWVNGSDCCHWESVVCNTTTRRVVQLNLYFSDEEGGKLNMSDFHAFEDLTSLDLSWNNIAACVQSEGSGKRLSNLRYLDLSFNMLNDTSNIQACLSGLSSLKTLNMTGNYLTVKSFHREGKERFSWPTNLEYLELSDNELSKGRLSWPTNLEVLDLSNNELSNDIISSFSMLQHLKSLYLRQGAIDDKRRLSWPTNLEVLDLSYNILNNDIISSFSMLQHLKSLYLRRVHINGERRLSWPTNLEVLDLSNGEFSNDIISSFSMLQHLKSLNLSNNQLCGSVDISGLCALSKLVVLDLSGNSDISSFVVPQGTNTSLSSMRVLELNNLKMEESMLQKLLRAFSSIRILSLKSEESKGTFVAGDFGYLDSLENLSLSGSYIGSEFFKRIGALASLKYLDLRRCRINGTLLTADWSNLQKPEVLTLSSNEFEGPLPITGELFSSL
ncbi:hypothetical protein L6164_025655 [Bauhinia variegata]|uniref:Uncharacterized protein n=1 Tax=Bauhinia variegata TaxID=167791 RepID=A0ACB9M187_BAUVA|nr:hypothetical protein L6164_025655 [Bauhinia variegata]